MNIERAGQLQGRRVAILATNGFEQSELFAPLDALKETGAELTLISLEPGSIKGWKEKDWGESIKVDKVLEEASPDDYDCLLIPGGVMNPDTLRNDKQAVAFVRAFMEKEKPVAAICHGPQVLIETGLLGGRKMTSYSSIKTDLMNAGVDWVDEEVVNDQRLITSRSPDDLPAFIEKMIEEFSDGHHRGLPSAEGFSATL